MTTSPELRETEAPLADAAISVRGLRRSYGSGKTAFEAVRGIDLDVATGTVTALLGTNGAGKTSAMEVMEGIAAPSAGQVSVLGMDPVADRARARRRMGVLLQKSGFPGDLTVAETLRMWASTVTDPRPLADSMAMVDLQGRADTRVLSLSGGEQRRLDLACTLMGHPDVVFLDEPSTGLDPESRRDVWELVRNLREDGCTVLLTTHYLDEAEALADELAIMHGGRIVRRGTPAEIAEGHPSTISFSTLPADQAAGLVQLGVEVTDKHGTTTLETPDLQRTLTALLTWAEGAGVRLDTLAARTASLESVFLAIAAQPTDRSGDQAAPAADLTVEARTEGATR